MPFSRKARSILSEQFADIYQATQEEYRRLLSALRDEHVDLQQFTRRVDALADRLVKLKRIHEQLVSERDELRRESAEHDPDRSDAPREVEAGPLRIEAEKISSEVEETSGDRPQEPPARGDRPMPS